ncbi:MAG: HlyC/CorC family transporter [Spirochaetia bacterium]|nr:HlyC/CorC family transporter [Spirochaetia bacterium]
MSLIFWEFAFVFGLILVAGFFVMAEMALVSARKGRLQTLADKGDKRALVAIRLTSNSNEFLSTVQVAITLVSVFTAAVGGASIARDLENYFIAQFPALEAYRTWVSFSNLFVVSVILTFFTLLFGELLPKRIALIHAEAIAVNVADFMKWLARIFSPTVKLFGFSTDAILAVLRLRKNPDATITEEEIKGVIEEGAQAGVIEEAEQDMVENILSLGDRTVNSIMTPRPDIVYIDLAQTNNDNWKEIAASDHSHFPVIEGSFDNVLGTVSVKSIWTCMVKGETVDIRAMMTPPIFGPENAKVLNLLELFKLHHRHTAIVTDEYGSVQGMVNQVDVLETIVGFIPTLDEKAEELIVRREDGTWLVDGMYNIEEFKHRFDLSRLEGEDESDFKTMGGFVMEHVGRMPKSGDHFIRQGYRYEVMDMDGRRVDKILVTPPPPEPPEAEEGSDEAAEILAEKVADEVKKKNGRAKRKKNSESRAEG